MATTYARSAVMDRDSRSNRYYRNAVERHWDPGEIDLERDVERHTDRMRQITGAAAEVPDVDELVRLDGDD